jgi:hypothetical protein
VVRAQSSLQSLRSIPENQVIRKWSFFRAILPGVSIVNVRIADDPSTWICKHLRVTWRYDSALVFLCSVKLLFTGDPGCFPQRLKHLIIIGGGVCVHGPAIGHYRWLDNNRYKLAARVVGKRLATDPERPPGTKFPSERSGAAVLPRRFLSVGLRRVSPIHCTCRPRVPRWPEAYGY